MENNPNVFEAKWELAELRGSLFSLARELAALRTELDRFQADEEKALNVYNDHNHPAAVAASATEAPAVPVARVIFKAAPVQSAAATRKALPARTKAEFHRLQPIRIVPG